MSDFKQFLYFDPEQNISEVISEAKATRYSIEVDYRSDVKSVMDGYARIALGFVSAGLKRDGYHVRHVFEERPIRILVSSRNWDDGGWVGMVHFNPEHDGGCFVISQGFYNKERKTVKVQKTKKTEADSPSEIVRELKSVMLKLKNEPDQHREKLKPVQAKRGPKK